MADNTFLNQNVTTGDPIRSVAKTANNFTVGGTTYTPKSQVIVVDVGGGSDASAESPLVLGQATKANSLPFVPANDLSSIEPAGSAVTGATMPTGGLGLTGWLSAIWKALTGTISTQAANPSSIYVNQITPGLTASQFPAQALVNGVVIKALKSNTGTVFIGSSSAVTDQIGAAPGYPLVAGEACSVAATNLNAVWAIADNTTDALAILGN